MNLFSSASMFRALQLENMKVFFSLYKDTQDFFIWGKIYLQDLQNIDFFFFFLQYLQVVAKKCDAPH